MSYSLTTIEDVLQIFVKNIDPGLGVTCYHDPDFDQINITIATTVYARKVMAGAAYAQIASSSKQGLVNALTLYLEKMLLDVRDELESMAKKIDKVIPPA